MAEQMADAITDLPRSAPGALWTRFLAWTKREITT